MKPGLGLRNWVSQILSSRVRGVTSSLNAKYPETLASIAVLETKTKGTLKNQVIYPKGNMKNPMTKDDVVEKYRALCAGAMDRNKSEQILQRLLDLDKTDALQELFDLLRG